MQFIALSLKTHKLALALRRRRNKNSDHSLEKMLVYIFLPKIQDFTCLWAKYLFRPVLFQQQLKGSCGSSHIHEN